MDETKNTVEENAQIAVPGEVVASTTTDDVEARLAKLEAEKNKAIEEGLNWKIAAMKAKSKKEGVDLDETDEERIARIVNEKLSEKKVEQIEAEKEELLRNTLKENKELKLAQLNKTNAPLTAMGTHSESFAVQSTTITSEQLSALKAKGFNDKDIERYKKNLSRYKS